MKQTPLNTSTTPFLEKANIETNLIEKGRYTKITIGIGIFLLVMVFAVIATFMISSDIKKVSSGINLAGRQRMLSQRTAKLVNLIDISSKNNNTAAIQIAQKELKLTYTLFDKTLNAFALGGDTLGADAKTEVTLSKVTDTTLTPNIEKALEIWEEFGPRVKSLATAPPSTISDEELKSVTDMSVLYNLELLKLMNNLTQGLENEANKKADKLKIIQGTALALVIANFSWVVISAFGSLRKTDKKLFDYAQLLQDNNSNLETTNSQLAQSQQELTNTYQSLKLHTEEAEARANELSILSRDLNLLKEESDTIFNSVDHGLCLIDSNFEIGKRVSAATYDIFETDHLVDRSLVDLLRPLITEKDTRTLESFLKLQFNPKTSNQQLDKYNPLKQIEITLNWDGQGFTNKHLGFNFERVMNENTIEAILVTVTDVTDTVVLENQLKQANQDQEKNILLIMEIMQTDRKELQIFLGQTTKELDNINDSLRDHGVSESNDTNIDDAKDLLESLFRKIHNIKGNASMLKLNSITETSQNIESKLSALRNKSNITGDQFLSAIVELAYLRELLTNYDELTASLLQGVSVTANSVGKKDLKGSEKIIHELESFTEKLSNDFHKKAFFNAYLPIDELSNELVTANKDIIIQLIRNSMAHGIETPEERKSANKWEAGQLSANYHLDQSNDNSLGEPCHSFTYRDDGKSLDKDAIVKQAISRKLVTSEKAKTMSANEIVALIFEPGFSTASNVNEHAGHGVGMDIIRNNIINKLNGKLRMGYRPGQYLEFNWLIPVNQS